MSPLPMTNTSLIFDQRPNRGPVTDKTFRKVTQPIQALKDGEVLVRVDYISIVNRVSITPFATPYSRPIIHQSMQMSQADADMSPWISGRNYEKLVK